MYQISETEADNYTTGPAELGTKNDWRRPAAIYSTPIRQ
jgi:hypothetical protein